MSAISVDSNFLSQINSENLILDRIRPVGSGGKAILRREIP